MTMKDELQPMLAVRVDPADMFRYVHALMANPPDGTTADGAATPKVRQWHGDSVVARAAQMRWDALNRAFGDARVCSWTMSRQRDQIHVPAALIAAAGFSPLKVAEDEVVFDIPTLLDATLQLCEPAGHG
jgi:hypothetical protein